MTWAVPDWWTVALLALAAFRTWRLLGVDDILETPRAWLAHRQPKITEFVECPWCSGSWIAAAFWLAWCAWPQATLVAAGLLSIMTIVGLLGARFDPD